ncbi:MAG: GNAT family N-acetyltransferase [Gammaproteobacteria bacterium]
MTSTTVRPARSNDLDALNTVIERAVMSWDLPERVKRLSLPVYRYSAFDLDALEVRVAETDDGDVVGVAAWEEAETKDAPGGLHGLLLHGIYVDPQWHHQGIGTRLFKAAEQAAQDHGFDGVLVKAQAGAEGFFAACGLERLAVENPERDYAYRYWKRTNA